MTGGEAWTVAGGFATVVTSVAALSFSVWSYRRSLQHAKLQNSSVLVNTLKQQFESSECLQSRRRLAGELLSSNEGAQESSKAGAIGPRFERDNFLVLEIFEQLGYLVRRGVLDEGIVWSVFAWDVIRYAEALKQSTGENLLHAARKRSDQPTLFADFEQLATRLRKVGLREHPGRRDIYDWRELRDYLKTECGGISMYEELLATPDQAGGSAVQQSQRQPRAELSSAAAAAPSTSPAGGPASNIAAVP